MKFTFSLFLVLLPFFSFSQEDGQILTFQCYPKGNVLADPIITLNGNSSMMFEFDILGEETPYLSYEIRHFDANWEKSFLSPVEYTSGFATGSLNNYDYSFDTEQYYTHYEFEYPDRSSRPKISGNFSFVVLGDNDEELYEQRFVVTEQIVRIYGNVLNAPGVGKRETNHQVNFTVNYEGLRVINPREEFRVNLYQNNRPDNALYNVQFARFDQENLYFNNPFKMNFEAGNEYRWFNTRSFRYLTDGVADRRLKEDGHHIYLVPDQIRKGKRYVPYQDFNGRYYVERQEGITPDLDSEYAYMHFYLKKTPEIEGKDVYVYGQLTDWEIKEENKLVWNEKQQLYEAVLYLKQGNYDYTYLTDTGDGFSYTPTEGSYYRTEDQYTVYVYYKPFGARFERLVGVTQFNSRFD